MKIPITIEIEVDEKEYWQRVADLKPLNPGYSTANLESKVRCEIKRKVRNWIEQAQKEVSDAPKTP